MSNLEILKQHRDALLLAEVAAWLHMLGKFHEDFLNGNHGLDIQIPPDLAQHFPQLNKLLTDTWPDSLWSSLGVHELVEDQAGNHQYLSIFSLAEKHRDQNAPSGIQRLMWDAHGRGSGIEKGALNRFFPSQQGTVYMATAFGKEASPIDLNELKRARGALYCFLQHSLNVQLNSQVNWATFRRDFVQRLEQDFRITVAETRCPINDVTLFDQTVASVAFFKAALAQVCLRGWHEPSQQNVNQKYHWRIVRVGLDGLRFWGETARANDILSRKALITSALDRVRETLEETYPLGLEIYRDENGSLFIVPDIKDLLDWSTSNFSLRQQLQDIARTMFNGEASFNLELSERSRNTYIFGKLATNPLPAQTPFPEDVEDAWKNVRQDICPVCRLRPQGFSPKATQRKICDVCEDRRLERTKRWLDELHTTVWIDEVADTNGRIALIVGRFGLESWLSGEALNTVMAFDPAARSLVDKARNNASYQFDYGSLLQDIQKALSSNSTFGGNTPLLDKLLLTQQRGRFNRFPDIYDLYVSDTDLSSANRENWRFALVLMRQQPSFARLRRIWETTRKFWQEVETTTIPTCVFHVCSRLEIIPCNGQALKGLNLSSFHTYELLVNGVRVSVVWDGTRFLTAENLRYLAQPEQLGKPLDQILTPGASFNLEEPTGYGSKNKAIGQVTIKSVQTLNTAYTPAIPLLAEPRTFMALVPADRALKVIEAIRRKYEVEMGKVRNRLPLTLGAVFFPRKTPLAAAIESGRRMLAFQTQSQVWQVQSVVQNNDPNAQDHHRKQTVELTLSCDGRDVKLSVPVMMGDGATLDVWYPYWRVEGKPTDRQRWFVGPDGEHWVHVCDLRQGDCVQFTPSTFDFEYLDTTARRFEVTYQHGQRRDPAKRQRPYLLEELDGLNAAWEAARRLSKSQIYDLDALIETKRQAWGKPVGPKALRLPADDPFRQLVRDALNETGLSPDLESAALRGWLRDALELHLEILKITLQLLETAR